VNAPISVRDWGNFARHQRFNGYGLKKREFPGLTFISITPEARAAWHKRLAKLNANKEAALEERRRHALKQRVGLAAARSPMHVANKKKHRRADKR